jgi:multidrug efflux pump subunit AcrA (membrane-fusion protein)
MQQALHRKLTILICLCLITIVLAGCANSTTSSIETGVVSEASVTNTIESSGAVSAKQLVTLSWATSGTVEKVVVKSDDTVTSGTELMSLDSKTASYKVIAAISTLIDAKQNLETVQKSTTGLAEAEIALIDAQTAYNDALTAYNGLDKPVGSVEYIAILQKNYLNAQAQTRRALGNFNGAADYLETSSRRADATAALAQARINEKYALLQLNHFSNPPDPVEAGIITSAYNLAKSKLAEAQKNYDAASDGNVDAINKAQAAVNAAQATVNKLSIIAPIDGQVAVVYAQIGDIVSAGTKAAVLYDRSKMYVDVSVTEEKISTVKVGDLVTISISGLGIKTTGKVTLVDPIGTSSSNVVNYTVRVELDQPDPKIYIGATATVVITTSDPQKTLYVPVSAILNDTDGEYVMQVAADGTTKRVQVVTGDISNEKVVVTGSLKKGDLVEIYTSTSSTTTTTNQNRGGLFGGFGGLFR